MTKVLFICHGNICRSTMAEFVLKYMVNQIGLSDTFHIESAATSREEIGNDTDPRTKRQLTEHGIPFTTRHARQMTKEDYDRFDYIIGMDDANVRDIIRITGGDPANKISKLLDFAGKNESIADPWYTGNFELTYKNVVEGCEAFLDFTVSNNG